MVEAYMRRSPLAHRGLAAKAAADARDADIAIGERPHRCQIDLRGHSGDPAFVQAVAGVIGLNPPIEANTVVGTSELAVLWLGPNEWLIVAPPGAESIISNKLRAGLAGLHAAVIDVSEARTTIVVAGPHARDLLTKATSLDLHPRVFGAGRCAQTGMAGTNVILWKIDETPTFDIFVHNSYVEHLWTWLEDASPEFRVAIAE